MRLGYLKIFFDLGRCRSFSQTAQMNNVSQSAISQVVNHLERKLGVNLVDRSTRPLHLTDPGKTFYEGCRSLLEQYENLEASICKSNARIVSTLQVAAIYSVGLLNMNRYVERFSTEHAGTEVHIEYLSPKLVYEKVQDGSADVGLISFARKSRELSVIPWRAEEMVLACIPQHDFARQQSLHISRLNGQKYVGFTRDLIIRHKIDQFLREQGVAVDVVLEFDNVECVKKAVEIGSGVALLPGPMLTREVEVRSLAAIPLQDCRFVRPLSIIYRRNQKLTPSASNFINLILQPEESNIRSDFAGDASRMLPINDEQPSRA
jgi:DNA-binding transcriptional LysR family regulator